MNGVGVSANFRHGRRGARSAPTARERAGEGPPPTPPAAGLGTAGRLASSAAAARGGLFKSYLRWSGGGLGCGAEDGGADPGGSRTRPAGASCPAGE